MDDVNDVDVDPTWREKGRALYRVATFEPQLAVAVAVLSVVAALLEGLGLSFIMPIVEVAQAPTSINNAEGLLRLFSGLYSVLGVPFTLKYLVAGVAVIMTIRFTASFLVGWLRAAIETKYVRYLQQNAFDHALDAKIAYFDEQGSDDILNTIVTQAEYAGTVIRYALRSVEQGLLAGMYIALALFISPLLTVIAAVFLGGITVLFRGVLDTGYSLGDRVAEAKSEIQSRAQAGTQGIREVKLFEMVDELRSGFTESVNRFEQHRIKLQRNGEAITNFYQLMTAVSVFGLIYLGLAFSAMELSELSVFLFAMFRLGPKISNFNKYLYRVEGELPHLVRTQAFIRELENNQEQSTNSRSSLASIERIEFDDVCFSYGSADETVISEISFSFDVGEYVAFVGPSGAGKSTVASLLARMYVPNNGKITANNEPINTFSVDAWRSKISYVRQDPYIFDDTLRQNITIGNRSATETEIERVCEIAQVTEFFEKLPAGYDTILGDRGVVLSGGQRQRVAIARALLKDADLLILDEATSDLDTEIERKVQTGIETMDQDYAMLVIAHRLSTVTNADQIHAMEDGKITETGTHDELVDQGGIYSRLYSAQST